MARTGIVLVGQGAPPSDCPPYMVFKLKQLAARRHAMGGEPSPEEAELDEKIRDWPRTAENDPFKSAFEAIADELRARLDPSIELALAYCEYCAPTFGQAVEELLRRDVQRLFVVPTMIVPGAGPAERDLHRETNAVRARRPDIDMVHAWPFDLAAVAELLLHQFQTSQRAAWSSGNPSAAHQPTS